MKPKKSKVDLRRQKSEVAVWNEKLRREGLAMSRGESKKLALLEPADLETFSTEDDLQPGSVPVSDYDVGAESATIRWTRMLAGMGYPLNEIKSRIDGNPYSAKLTLRQIARVVALFRSEVIEQHEI